MIPLRDENPSGSVPRVTMALIAINCALFAYELMLGPGLRDLFLEWGLVPQRLTLAIRYGDAPLVPTAITLVTSMFLHGGWLHLIGNMWYLWIFGDNVEDHLGHGRYLGFYLGSGVVAALTQYVAQPGSEVPTVGASGAIAAVLGAYAVTYPHARVVTLIPLVFYFPIVHLSAFLMLGMWFVYQFLSGALVSSAPGGGVAWWAHIGGFVFGVIAVKVLAPARRAPTAGTWFGAR